MRTELTLQEILDIAQTVATQSTYIVELMAIMWIMLNHGEIAV